MGDYLIVVINRQEARFFTIEPVAFPELESGPNLVEGDKLVNPEAMVDAQERYTDSKTGRGSAPMGGLVHGYDDHRDQHLDELRHRFADKVMAHIRRLCKTQKARTIIVAASARMRRFLHDELDVLAKQGIEIHKVSKNMINFSPQKIHLHLAEAKLVPEKKRITI
jgi:hypothetical protein